MVFLGPMIGVMIASFTVTHRFRLKVDDLYVSDPSSIYWFSYGFNLRAPMAWVLGTFPSLPGFNLKVEVAAGWSLVYSICFSRAWA